jgi:lipopolysaccharide transport system permease protein
MGIQEIKLSEQKVLVIEPEKGFVSLKLDELWDYRDLAFILSWRDITARYKHTVIGIAWAVIQPMLSVCVFSVIFSKFARIPSEGTIPYPIFAYAAMLPAQYFFAAMTSSSGSLVSNPTLITKVYFPRLLIPISTVLSPLVDFGFAFLVFVAIMLWWGIALRWDLLLAPIFVLLALLNALGVGVWLAALGMRYRDIHHLIPFATQLLTFSSPIVYPTTLVWERWRFLYSLNPLVGIIEGFRWSILGLRTEQTFQFILTSFIVIPIVLITGIIYFKNVEKEFADVL